MTERATQVGRNHLLRIVVAGVVVAVILGGGGAVVFVLTRTPEPVSASAGSLGPGGSGVVNEAIESARSYLRSQKPEKAEVILRAAVDRYPGEQALQLLFGETLLSIGKMAEAYEHYSAGIFIGPDHPEYRHAAGTIASELGLLEDAESHYLVAQKLAPGNPKHPLYLAQVQRRLGKPDEARANLVLATTIEPDLAIGWASLAGIALDENRPTVAMDYIRKARAIEPDRTAWRVVEARVLLRQNRAQEAATLLYAIREDERLGDETVLSAIGSALGLLDRAGEAAEIYISAANRQRENAELSFHAAIWLDRSGQQERAKLYAAEAARLGHEGARTLLGRLNMPG